jgi:hypothetical protein
VNREFRTKAATRSALPLKGTTPIRVYVPKPSVLLSVQVGARSVFPANVTHVTHRSPETGVNAPLLIVLPEAAVLLLTVARYAAALFG